MDYHGLKLLWGWMIDAAAAGNGPDGIDFKIDLLKTLSCLPVPNKTMLLDSKIISIVEKWTTPSGALSITPATVPVVKQEEEVLENPEKKSTEDLPETVSSTDDVAPKEDVPEPVVVKEEPQETSTLEPDNSALESVSVDNVPEADEKKEVLDSQVPSEIPAEVINQVTNKIIDITLEEH